MKKHFLLGLAATLLPWTAWAQSSSPLTVTAADVDYNGNGTKPNITVTFGTDNTSLTEGNDYEVSYTLGGKSVSVRDAGTYTATVKGLNAYAYYPEVSTTFTVKKKQLTSLELQAGEKQYGAKDNEVDLSMFVKSISGLANENSEVEDDEKANALKCLYLYRIDQEEEAEIAGKSYKVLVRGKKDAENTESNYYYEEASSIDAVDMMVVARKLTLIFGEDALTRVYNGSTTDLTSLQYTLKEGGIVNNDVVNIEFAVNDNKELKNVATYTLTATPDNKNYTIDDTFSYEITRAILKIAALDETSLKKVYSGEEKAGADLTGLYSITTEPETGETAEELGLKMVMGEGGGSENLPNVGTYLVNPTVNGTTIWMGQENKGYLEPALLPNYSISYDRDNLKYAITERPVYYYFESDGTKYTGTAITLTDDSYTLKTVDAVEGESGFVGEDSFTEDAAPKAKFAATEVKNVKTEGYALETANANDIKASNKDGEDVTKNYTFTLKEEEGKNVFMVTPGEMTLTVKPQTVAFGTEIDDDVKATWAAYNNGTGNGTGTVITNTPDFGDDRTAMRKLITFTLSEAAATGESGTYTEGIIIGLKSEGLSDDEKALLANYGGADKIKKNNGTLTIEGVSETLELDGSEVAEEVEGETILDKLTRLNGATVSSVTIKNLKNFIASTGYGETNVIKKEQWYTLVLPFDVTVSELSSKFGYAIVNIPNTNNENPNNILFKLTMQTVPANTLMAFKVADETDWDGKEVTFTTKKIVAPTNEYTVENGNADKAGNKFIGVYEKDVITGDDDWTMTPWDGGFWPASYALTFGLDGFEVYPLNGYVHFEQPATAGIARTIGFENPDGTTSIVSATTGRVISNNAEGWYTIGGIKLNGEPTQKGIYINNGKKVVIK